MDDTRVKFVSDVEIDRKVGVRSPLKLERDNQRRFIRLDISSPIALGRIKDVFGKFNPDAEDYALQGEVLNISAGGVLVEMESPVNEGDLVAMRFSLDRVEPLEGVLGLVKRCDPDDGTHLVGVQFVNRADLADKLTHGELEVLSAAFAHFEECVQDLLNRYIYQQQADEVDTMTFRHHRLQVIALTMIAMAAVGAVLAASIEPSAIIIHIDQGGLAWADSRIAEKLDLEFSRHDWLRVINPASVSPGRPDFPRNSYDLDSLRDWGLEVGGRYLLFVDVHSERLECRQTLGLPLVLHRYETMGIVEGELRLVDLREGRLAVAEPFRFEEKAARIYQTSIDDDIADPDLKLSAPAKIRLFDRLETRMVDKIVRRVEPLLRGDN